MLRISPGHLKISEYPKKNSLKWLTGLSVVVLFVILFFGLRPKDFNFSNAVSRIEGQAGIRFGKCGIAYHTGLTPG